ncbi:MAG: nickel pincer cofactor biosynthesis protein LarC, partial [Oscillospiraceae bacterium]|nr:nickel pincer cofactor biosynthesis protein LarC [Oscillospiraceae bacterium]
MKTLYLECAMGAAGDMLMAALYELCEEKERFLRDMNALLPGVAVEAERVTRQGIAGTHMRVLVSGQEEGHGRHHDHGHGHHHHEHRSLADVQTMIDAFPLPEAVRENAKSIYGRIAEAESRAHGVSVGEVHFHEVGALDAVADVTGVCYLMYLLAPDAVAASPVTVGSGTASTAHGLLPVPAPATARLLEGVPIAPGDIAAELCTPTGAALLRHFSGGFGPMPAGAVLGCGYGCGTKDFPRANCLRAFLLETAETAGGPNDAVTELKANIDDMTGEALGFALERLLAAGALDVSYVPAQMKKNRPGVLLTCLCRPADADRLAAEILRHTATFGVRRTDCSRSLRHI